MADLNFQSSLFLSNYMFNFKTFNFVHQKTAIVKELHKPYFLFILIIQHKVSPKIWRILDNFDQ